MKKSIRRAMISMLVLTLVGAGLCLWLYKAEGYDKKEQYSRSGNESQGPEKENSQEVGAEPGVDGSGDNPGEEDALGGSGDNPGEESALGGSGGNPGEEGALGGSGDNPGEESTLDGSGSNPEADAALDGGRDDLQGEDQEASLIFAGDIYLSNYVLEQYDREGIGGVVSEKLLSQMQQGGIVMANEEFPFSTGGVQAPDKQFTFRVDPFYVKIFQEMGVDVVSLANNHALDYGPDALADSFQALDGAGIAYVGAGAEKARASQPFFAQAGQKTFGFLAASRVIPVAEWNIENQQPGMLCTYDSAALCEAIRTAKPQCDFLTVYVHWGIERENVPQEYQRQLAREYIDAGADLVVGAHPHVLQGIEYYNGKPIAYSLGNYIFNPEIASTVLLKVTVTPENESRLQLVPAYASGAKTQEMDGEQAAELYQFMEEISYGIHIGAEGEVELGR